MSDLQQRYRRLGKYELHQLLGEGAMGIVWKAYDTVLRRYVALKLLSASFRKTKDMQERFLREARAAGAIHVHAWRSQSEPRPACATASRTFTVRRVGQAGRRTSGRLGSV